MVGSGATCEPVPDSLQNGDFHKRLLMGMVNSFKEFDWSGYMRKRDDESRSQHIARVLLVTQGRLFVPKCSLLRMRHLKALKYQARPFMGSLWVMKLGLPSEWKVISQTELQYLIFGPCRRNGSNDDVYKRDGRVEPTQPWKIGFFSGHGIGGGGNALATTDRLRQPIACRGGEVYVILNKELMERMRLFANLFGVSP
jgi:hypothetical protein